MPPKPRQADLRVKTRTVKTRVAERSELSARRPGPDVPEADGGGGA